MHVPMDGMNSYKVMHTQAKFIKAARLYSCGGGGRDNFTSSKKYSIDRKYLNNLIASTVDKYLKINKSLEGNLNTIQS